MGLVEPQPDVLRTQLTAGRTAVWQHWTLTLGSQYPLRLLDDVEQSPPLAGLLSALRPFGSIVATEAQLVVQAATGRGDWTLRRGWRGATTALKLQLEAKRDFALRDDVAALEAKLLGVPYVVTVRVVVIAAGAQAEADARTLLGPLVGWLPCRVLPAPPHAFIDEEHAL